MSFELVTEVFQQQRSHGGGSLQAFRCTIDGCKCVELTLSRMYIHLAVSHGVRRISEERIKELREHGIKI